MGSNKFKIGFLNSSNAQEAFLIFELALMVLLLVFISLGLASWYINSIDCYEQSMRRHGAILFATSCIEKLKISGVLNAEQKKSGIYKVTYKLLKEPKLSDYYYLYLTVKWKEKNNKKEILFVTGLITQPT